MRCARTGVEPLVQRKSRASLTPTFARRGRCPVDSHASQGRHSLQYISNIFTALQSNSVDQAAPIVLGDRLCFGDNAAFRNPDTSQCYSPHLLAVVRREYRITCALMVSSR